jgi:hypothetical protein
MQLVFSSISQENIMRSIFLLLFALFVLSACNLGRPPETQELSPAPTITVPDTAAGKPVATIISPQSGEEFVVDRAVLVSVNATDIIGVTRVQLLANNQPVKSVASDSVAGEKNLNVLLDYTPRSEGVVTLQVIASRGSVASDPVEIQIAVRSSQAQVTSTSQPSSNVPIIDPNDPTCRALINVGLNFRTGPGTDYDISQVLLTGTVAPIIGRLGDSSWLKLRVGFREGWVSAQYTTRYGDCSRVPVVAPPASPTATRSPQTATPPPSFTPVPSFTPLATNIPGKPDLVITQIGGPDTVIIASGDSSVTATYSVTITNTGSGSTGQFTSTIEVTPGDPASELGVVGGLNAGESIVLNVDLTFDASGSYSIVVRADSDADVSEISEVNNTGTISVFASNA